MTADEKICRCCGREFVRVRSVADELYHSRRFAGDEACLSPLCYHCIRAFDTWLRRKGRVGTEEAVTEFVVGRLILLADKQAKGQFVERCHWRWHRRADTESRCFKFAVECFSGMLLCSDHAKIARSYGIKSQKGPKVVTALIAARTAEELWQQIRAAFPQEWLREVEEA